jgi:hypothetical protein
MSLVDGNVVDRDVVIVDLDGTLADCKDIAMKYLHPAEGPKQWDAFWLNIANPEIVSVETDVLACVNALYSTGYDIHIWTGRSDITKAATEAWLEHFDVPYNELRMRPHTEHTDDFDIKRQWLNEDPEFRKRIVFVLEDRTRVVEMWREEKIRCFQVRPGNF